MNINYDTTAEQDFAIEALRKRHNRNTGETMNDRQFAKRIIDEAMTKAELEASGVTAEGLRDSYKTATPAVRAQIDTLLGR